MIHRQIPNSAQTLFLTFDDGPHPEDTLAVLEILDKHHAKATFFLVAKRAEQNPTVTQEIIRRGHSIGSHSLDHSYSVFIRGKAALRVWIKSAEKAFLSLGVNQLVGFRPPVGIVTPELIFVLKEMKIPLILWNTRYFDSTWQWSSKKALCSLDKMKPGSIILLHDVQKPKNKQVFLQTLDLFLTRAQSMNWRFEKLSQSNF